MHLSTLPGVPYADKLLIAQEVLEQPQEELDIFLRGFREAYPTAEAMCSPAAVAQLETTFNNVGMSTDEIERINSSLLRAVSVRAPASKFIFGARANLISQAEEMHCMRGKGASCCDPCKRQTRERAKYVSTT